MKKLIVLAVLVGVLVWYFVSVRQDSYLMTADISEIVAPIERDAQTAAINEKYQTVRHIFEKSCFDCHSKFTNYPVYYQVPFVKELIDEDIRHGRSHLDLSSDFPFGGKEDQHHLLEEIKEEIESDAMPLKSYRLTHWGRLIQGAQRDSVFLWIDESMALLKSGE